MRESTSKRYDGSERTKKQMMLRSQDVSFQPLESRVISSPEKQVRVTASCLDSRQSHANALTMNGSQVH